MAVVFSNNATTALASSVTSSATSITVQDGSVFPTLSGSDYTYITLEDLAGNVEIVKLTARSVNVLTIVRAQDGTSARAFGIGSKCELRLTAALLNEVAAQADTDTNTTYTAGSGLALTGTVFSNTSPDRTVALTGAGATSISGTYPNFTITSTDTNTVYTHPSAHPISFITGLQAALDGKVDDSQVLTNVPAGALFTDTVYTLPFADNSANWNTAYTYSQVGHVELDGTSIISGSGASNGTRTPMLWMRGRVGDSVSQINVVGPNIEFGQGGTLDDTPAFKFSYQGVLTATGRLNALGGNSDEWNTAYTYSQVGHLPLAGGTLTGDINLNTNDLGNVRSLQLANLELSDLMLPLQIIADANDSSPPASLGTYDGPHPDGLYMRSYTGGVNYTLYHTGHFSGTHISNWNTAYGWGNHASQSYATQSYVGTAISNLVDSSPATLDTLNELAAALGDDPNFATTVTNSIATKLPLTGGTLTGRLIVENNIGDDASWTGGILIRNTGAVAGEPAIAFQNTAMGDNYWILGSNQDNEFHFSYGSVFQDANTKVLIKPDGKVGINRGAGILSDHLEVGGNILATGTVTATGGNSTNWNTAYTYSQVGHLPLSGGTLTGKLNSNSGFEIFYNDSASGPVWDTFVYLGKVDEASNHGNVAPVYQADGSYGMLLQANSDGLFVGLEQTNTGNYNPVIKWGDDHNTGEDLFFRHADNAYVAKMTYNSFIVNGDISATGGNSTNWNTAYGWGNHASAGYVVGNTSNAINLTITGVMQANNGYKVGTSTVIDSSRNFTAAQKVLVSAIAPANVAPATDNVELSGYGLFGNRGALYLTNAGGTVQIGNGSQHSTNTSATFSTASVNLGVGRTLAMNGTTVIDSSRNLTNIGTLNGGTPWHSGNDGSGSGLDADLLDGQQGSYYLNTSTKLFKSGAEIAGSQDLNTYRITGYYSQDANADATSGSNYPVIAAGILEVITGDQGNGLQTEQRYSQYNTNNKYVRHYYNGTWTAWAEQWNSSSDGSGSGLDADLLDGQHGSYYAPATGGSYLPLAGGTITGGVTLNGNLDMGAGNIDVNASKGFVNSGAWTRNQTPHGYIDFGPANTSWAHIYTDRPNFYFNANLYVINNLVWNAGNDGSGSGLDADLLDGVQGASYLRSDATDTATGVMTFSNTVNLQGSVVFSNPIENFNTFTANKIHHSIETNMLAGKGSKLKVTIDGVESTAAASGLTNQNFEDWNVISATAGSAPKVINIDLVTNGLYGASGITYAAGFVVLNFYSSPFPSGWSARVKNKDGVWTAMTMTKIGTTLRGTIPIGNYITDLEFTLESGTTGPYVTGTVVWGLCEVAYYGSRMALSQGASVTSIGGYIDGNLTFGKTSGAPFIVNSTSVVTNLNADLLDGINSTSFLRSDANDTKSGNLVLQTSGAATDINTGMIFEVGGTYSDGRWRTRFRKQDKGGGIPLYIDTSSATANVYTETVRIGTYSGNAYELEVFGDINATGNLYDGGNAVWHAGNDGSGSGLDADLLDGQQGSYYATAASVTAIAALDPIITLTGAVTGTGTMTNLGNVSIATTATADPTLTLTGDVTGAATFTNLGNATLTATVADDSHDHTALPRFIEGAGATGAWTGTHPDIEAYTDGMVVWYKINFNGAATTTLNINGLGAKTIYRSGTSKLTTHWPVNSVIPLVYSATLNGGCFLGGYGYDSNQTYDLRWSSSVVNGTSIIHGYQLLMEGADTKFYPVTVGGVANSTTNTVQTAPLRIGGQMLYYSSSSDIAANTAITNNLLYESIETGEGEYWMNRTSSSSWTARGLPLYIVGTVNANNELILDNSTTTAFLTNALPTTEDGKVYVHVGYSDNEDDLWRLSVTHPIFEFKGGAIRRYTPALIPSEVLDAVKTVDGASSGLDADLLDGQQGSYYYPASNPSGYNNYTHPAYTARSLNTTGAQVLDILTTDAIGSVTNATTRTMTLADLGYTGATNANYITNNNQLTNGAGYTTYTANQAVNNNSVVTFNQVYTTNNGAGTNYKIGDDVWIGDINVANTFRVQGSQNAGAGYITFGNNSNAQLGRTGTGALTWDSGTVWHSGNDGSGSGLDADLLDGQHGSYYAPATGGSYMPIRMTTPYAVIPTGGWATYNLGNGTMLQGSSVGLPSGGTHGYWHVTGRRDGAGGYVGLYFQDYSASSGMWIGKNLTSADPTWERVWSAGTDGSGSGLDADLLDGQQGSYYAPASHNHSGVYLPVSGKAADSELLDGINSTSFLRSDADDFAAGKITFSTGIARNNHNVGHLEGSYNNVGGNSTYSNPIYTIGSNYNPPLSATTGMYGIGYSHPNLPSWGSGKSSGWGLYVAEAGGIHATISVGGMWSNGAITSTAQGTLWGSSNDGSGSGLDADLLDGQQGSYYYPASNPNGYQTTSGSVAQSNYVSGSAFATTASPGSVLEYQQASGQTDTRLSPTTDWYNSIRMGHGNPYNYYSNTIAMRMTGGGSGTMFTQYISNNNPQGWRTQWDSGNDGSGSGLDADLLDGQQGSYYAPASHSHSYLPLAGGTVTGATSLRAGGTHLGNHEFASASGTSTGYSDAGIEIREGAYGANANFSAPRLGFHWGGVVASNISIDTAGAILIRNNPGTSYENLRANNIYANGTNVVWHAGNDGSGSGLDADLLDGQHGSYYAPASHSHSYLPLTGGTTTGTINAPTFNATSTTSGGFQGIDADTITAPSFTWTSDLDTGMWHAAADAIGFATGGVNRLTINSTGITAVGNVTAYSDARLKESIEVIPGALAKVQQLRGVTFTRNDVEDLEKRHTGVIAQEVEAVLPEAVSEDTAGIKNVAYGNMVGLLIEAIKELKSEVDDLKQQLENK